MTTETFFQYWALLWLAMLTFGAFTSALMHLFGAELGGLVKIMLFALNQASSNSSLPFELQNPFFQVGYALPFNQIVTGGRYILFAVYQLDIGRCVGVLIGWTGFIFIASVCIHSTTRLLAKTNVCMRAVNVNPKFMKRSRAAASRGLQCPP